MATLTRSEQARINGARSRGPVTAEGKARSARLKNEDLPAFEGLVERRTQDFRPVNSFEASLVREIAALERKYDRLSAIETRHIDLQIAQETEAHRRQAGSLRGVTSLDVTAFGIGKLVETTRILPFYAIELTRLQRARRQVLDTLIAYRKNFRMLDQSEDPIELQQLDHWNEPSLEDLESSATAASGPAPLDPPEAPELVAPAVEGPSETGAEPASVTNPAVPTRRLTSALRCFTGSEISTPGASNALCPFEPNPQPVPGSRSTNRARRISIPTIPITN
ncbi:hypothetical protein [uncultured Paludibaculum sp.]|uniref:hypothetical protein n=1 Tax=uncultured Paludibaculum sp. TaxID=1765020 RepID=UPI002AABF01D|nr:hypothetical protein [uncultured Paludibaculum sp.]